MDQKPPSKAEHGRYDEHSQLQLLQRLPRAMAPIDPQITGRHETTRVANQKHRRATILIRHAQFAQHVLRRPLSPPLRVLLEQLLYHGGHDVTRGDGVDTNAVLAPFGREVAGELEHAGFACVVGAAYEALWLKA